MAKDQLEGENVRQVMISVWHDKYLTHLTGMDADFPWEQYSTHTSRWYICLQAELKHKLSERNKLLSEYEVSSSIIHTSVHLLDTYTYMPTYVIHLSVTIAANRAEGPNTAAATAEDRWSAA